MSYVCLWSPSWPAATAFDVELAPALLAHAPRVVIGDHGRVWADARGLHPIMLAERLLDVVRVHGVTNARAGTALTPIAAEVAATWTSAQQDYVMRRATAGDVIVRDLPSPMTAVHPGRDRDFIAGFRVAVLDPTPSLATLLDGIGVDTCGRLAALEAESVEVRLGVDGVRLWDRARADDGRRFFRTPVRALPSASLEWMEYALRDVERLLFVINALLASLCATLVAKGERARALTLVFTMANRTLETVPLRSSRPTTNQTRWLRLVREAIERIVLPDAVTGIALRIEAVAGNDGAQGDLFDRGFASADAVEIALADLMNDQEGLIVAPKSSNHPLVDQRTRWVAEEPAVIAGRSGGYGARPLAVPQLTLQLKTPPQLITVTTNPRRDHHIPVRYHDSVGWHRLLDVAGPDRVSGGAWDAAYAREYFRCVREDGTLVWLFHGQGAWYFHGWWD